MAGIIKRSTKAGDIYFKIEVLVGTVDGKQTKRSTTYYPPKGVSEKKALEMARREAAKYEEMVHGGDQFDTRLSFAEYAAMVVARKEAAGKKRNTLLGYDYLLQRILPVLGPMKLKDIRASHLSRLYEKLSEPGIRKDKGYAVAKPRLRNTMKERKLTQAKLAAKAGLSVNTVAEAQHGNHISVESARKIATALQLKETTLFTTFRNEERLSRKTLLEYHRCVHAILERAKLEHLVPRNVADEVEVAQADKHSKARHLEAADVRRVLDAAEKEPLRWKAMTYFLLGTGCRRGEAAAIKFSDINWEDSLVTISKTLCYDSGKGVYEGTTKTSDYRVLVLPDDCIAVLKELCAEQQKQCEHDGKVWTDDNHVFTQRNGKPVNPSVVTSYYRRFGKKNGLPSLHPHCMRHTVSSALIASGIDVVTVSAQLGHSRVSTTEDIYAHALANARAKASAAITAALFKAPE